jgi:hypothetical protein
MQREAATPRDLIFNQSTPKELVSVDFRPSLYPTLSRFSSGRVESCLETIAAEESDMPRVKRTLEVLGRIDTGRAAGQASVILFGQREDCGAAMRTFLDAAANAGEDGDAADHYFGIAIRLA